MNNFYDLQYCDFTDVINEGLIVVDNNGIIKLYNEKAKELIGIKRNIAIEHDENCIEKGDIVIIADTELGRDDGNLEPNDLKIIGINDNSIRLGMPLLAIGEYGIEESASAYKISDEDIEEKKIELEHEIRNIKIKIEIDSINKTTNITVDDISYDINYYNNFGHIVVTDKHGKLKFYQTHGYTSRGEEIKHLLNGKIFSKKEIGINYIKVEGTNLLNNHIKTSIIEDLLDCAKGKDISYRGKYGSINGVNVLCGLKEIDREKQRVGAILAFEDLSEFKKIENLKNYAINELETIKEEIHDKEIYSEMFPKFIGSSNKIMEVKKMAYKASRSNSNLLILGESGTGKSILAREIHNASLKRNKPFIHVNCNSIPENLLESELFGYEKGAFTGASNKGKTGYFEMADGGTIFLDEIGDISKNMQVKLLQVLQNKKFYKVGGNKEINVNVRIIAATNRDLEKEVVMGNFREDLYYRINVFPIYINPLRERKEDIHELLEYIIPKVSSKVGCELKRISGEAVNKLMMYSWPGNIRELENVIERSINLCDNKTIMSKYIKINIDNKEKGKEFNYIRPLKEIIKDVEKDIIKNVMLYTKGDKKKSMEILQIKKTSFYEKLKNI